jgi:hypothetical protein
MGFSRDTGSHPTFGHSHLTVNLKRVEALSPFLTSSRHDAELILHFSIALLINLIVGPLVSRVGSRFTFPSIPFLAFHIFRESYYLGGTCRQSFPNTYLLRDPTASIYFRLSLG